MRFFKSCPTYKQTRAHEMLFRYFDVLGSGSDHPGSPPGTITCRRKPPRPPEAPAKP